MALRRRTGKPTFRRRRYFKKGGKKMTVSNNVSLTKRVLALEKQSKITKHIEYTSYVGWRDFGMIPGVTETGKGYGGVNYSIHCLNVPNFHPIAFNTVVYKTYEQVYQSSLNLSVEFRVDTWAATLDPITVGITYFILKPKKELQALSPPILSTIEWNRHYLSSGLSTTVGTPVEVTQGLLRQTPHVYINRQLFQVIAYKRFYIGNKAVVKESPLAPDENYIDNSIYSSHKKFFHKIKINKTFKNSITSAGTQGGAMEMTEEKMPLTSKYYLICFTDQDKDEENPAYSHLNMNMQGQMKIYISN